MNRGQRRRDADLACLASDRGDLEFSRLARELMADAVAEHGPIPAEVDAALARIKAACDNIDSAPFAGWDPGGRPLPLDDDVEGLAVPDVRLPFRVSTPAIREVACYTAARALWRAGAALLELGARIDPAVEVDR